MDTCYIQYIQILKKMANDKALKDKELAKDGLYKIEYLFNIQEEKNV